MDRNQAIELIMRATVYTDEEREALELLIPELAESENERIRKKLIQFLTAVKNISEAGRSTWYVREEDAGMCDSFILYLERQKEKKPTSFNEPYNPDEYEVVMEGNATSLKRKEQNPAWSEEDENNLRLAVELIEYYEREQGISYKELKLWLKSRRSQSKQEWSEEDEQFLLVCKNALRKYQISDHWDANITSNWLEKRLKSV